MSHSSITSQQIEHLAKLSRLELSEQDLEQYKEDLGRILEHVSAIQSLDLAGVEGMARPHQATNQLDPDEPTPPLEQACLLGLAPVVEGPFIAVPKVLDEGSA